MFQKIAKHRANDASLTMHRPPLVGYRNLDEVCEKRQHSILSWDLQCDAFDIYPLPEQDVDDSKWETSKDGTVVKKQPGLTSWIISTSTMFAFPGGGGGASGGGGGGPYIERITDDAREDEMEENMQAVCLKDWLITPLSSFKFKVGSVLSNLKEMSQAMGGEIERQNKQLDKISGKTDVADVNIGRANTRTEKILKK